VNNSILGDGCVIRAGSRINHSVIGLRALVNENCTIDDALIMGADYYETLEECALVPGCLPMGLGAPPVEPIQALTALPPWHTLPVCFGCVRALARLPAHGPGCAAR
jgi:carbonic anhydrase/acetyltransferase-like protein (isoleucine patch superfamily)